MISSKKVAANQNNGRKSRGPRTAAGKARASRNARRHGLSVFKINDAAMAEPVKKMVGALCQGDNDPLLREPAMMIAENQLWLSCIKAEKVACIGRLRERMAYSLARDSRIARAKARIHLFEAAVSQLQVVEDLVRKTEAAGGDPEQEPLPPDVEAAWPPAWAKIVPEAAERDEHDAMVEAIHDLVRLLRYEQRAWSRLKKAVRAFMAIKLINREQKDTA
jgi:hypothetical protein